MTYNNRSLYAKGWHDRAGIKSKYYKPYRLRQGFNTFKNRYTRFTRSNNFQGIINIFPLLITGLIVNFILKKFTGNSLFGNVASLITTPTVENTNETSILDGFINKEKKQTTDVVNSVVKSLNSNTSIKVTAFHKEMALKLYQTLNDTLAVWQTLDKKAIEDVFLRVVQVNCSSYTDINAFAKAVMYQWACLQKAYGSKLHNNRAGFFNAMFNEVNPMTLSQALSTYYKGGQLNWLIKMSTGFERPMKTPLLFYFYNNIYLNKS